MACGTPVIAFDFGSTKEVIKNGKTGFVVPFLKGGKKNFDGLIEAIDRVGEIKREDCREWVEKNFSIERMVKNYEKIYYQIL
jgi:glycosyltransferase involved in cell wall biosynthesis